ncbi:MAG: DUF1249 domain-containing protein [Thermoanaerobaculia bacterium]|nr:DUF1249 domain-containing protein [Thermoanaerobaculia bacterium]
MPRRHPYEMNYARLEKLLGEPPQNLQPDRAYRFRASGFMDLVVERLPDCEETGRPVLSLCHYFTLNGDLCQDPEMTVRVSVPRDGRHGMIEALSFQQAVPPVYQVVYPQPGRFYPHLKRELNAFLGYWLRNLEQQGHRSVEAD